MVITDIQMPLIDGFQVANLIKQIDKNFNQHGECPILAATAFMSDSIYIDAARVGIKEVLNKPVKRDLLFTCLKKYFFSKK